MKPMAGQFTQRRFDAFTLSFVGSATSTSGVGTIDISGTGRIAGDICIIMDCGTNPSSEAPPAAVTPSGFTRIHNAAAPTNIRDCISVKILDGTEGVLSGIAGTGGNGKIALVFRPSIAISGFTARSMNNEGTSGDPSAQSILAASAPSTPVIAYGFMGQSGGGSLPTASISPSIMTGVSVGARARGHYALLTAATLADISYDMADAGVNVLQSGYLTFQV